MYVPTCVEGPPIPDRGHWLRPHELAIVLWQHIQKLHMHRANYPLHRHYLLSWPLHNMQCCCCAAEYFGTVGTWYVTVEVVPLG